MTNPFEKNTAKQVSILTTDQSADTNYNRIEHISLSETNIGLKELAIVCAQFGNNLIAEANQSSALIDRQGRGYW